MLDAMERLGKRLRAVMLVIVPTAILPVILPLLWEMARSAMGPREPAVILWWPETEQAGMGLAFLAGCLTAVILGALMLFREPARWWRLVRWPWLVLGLISLGVTGVSLRSEVLIFPDRLVASGLDRQGYWEELYPFRTAERVEVGCWLASGRGKGTRASLAYRVHFPYGDSFELRRATSAEEPRTLANWIKAVSWIDRGALRNAPRVSSYEGPSVDCIRTLRRQLDEPKFRAALSMLGISDEAFMRKYAEPHETWRRPASGNVTWDNPDGPAG